VRPSHSGGERWRQRARSSRFRTDLAIVAGHRIKAALDKAFIILIDLLHLQGTPLLLQGIDW
jgi:hypothetical protein